MRILGIDLATVLIRCRPCPDHFMTIAVVTTVDGLDQARSIAATLVERRLAACVQVSKIESVYRWQGAVQQDDEYRLLVKTTRDRYAEVEAAIVAMHPYELPAIFALDSAFAYEPFADWVAGSVSADDR